MNRLQISLSEDQYDFLRSEAFVSGQSMAALLRDLLDEAIQRRRDEILQNDPIWQAIGVAQEIEGPTDVSANIDRYLYGEPVAVAGSQPLQRVAEAPDEHLTD